MLDGEFDECMAAVQIEFHCDVVAVMFDGANADAKRCRDFPARLTVCYQFQDPAFGPSKLFERGNLRSKSRSAR